MDCRCPGSAKQQRCLLCFSSHPLLTSLQAFAFTQLPCEHALPKSANHGASAQLQCAAAAVALAGLWLLLAVLALGCALHVVASWLLNLVASKVSSSVPLCVQSFDVNALHAGWFPVVLTSSSIDCDPCHHLNQCVLALVHLAVWQPIILSALDACALLHAAALAALLLLLSGPL